MGSLRRIFKNAIFKFATKKKLLKEKSIKLYSIFSGKNEIAILVISNLPFCHWKQK